jgi:hypothetical protein
MADTLCAYCKESVVPDADRCEACGRNLVGPDGRRRLATRRDPNVATLPRSDDFPGPGECPDCPASMLEIRNGEVVAYTLVDCDEKFCIYEGTAGGVA